MGGGEGWEEPFLASSGAKRNRPAFPQHSTLARITAAAFPLVAQCRQLARATLLGLPEDSKPGYGSAYHCPSPSTNLPPRPTPTYTIFTASKTTGLPVAMVFYTKTFLLVSISDRQQNSGALRGQVQEGRGATSARRTRLLKANQATLPESARARAHTHTHTRTTSPIMTPA